MEDGSIYNRRYAHIDTKYQIDQTFQIGGLGESLSIEVASLDNDMYEYNPKASKFFNSYIFTKVTAELDDNGLDYLKDFLAPKEWAETYYDRSSDCRDL